jgi:hypothetical protein
MLDLQQKRVQATLYIDSQPKPSTAIIPHKLPDPHAPTRTRNDISDRPEANLPSQQKEV